MESREKFVLLLLPNGELDSYTLDFFGICAKSTSQKSCKTIQSEDDLISPTITQKTKNEAAFFSPSIAISSSFFTRYRS